MNEAVLSRSPLVQKPVAPQLNWTAEMVRPLADQGVGTRASFLRKRFVLNALNGSERLHISAYGLYVAYLNGQRIGTDVLTPGWTCYKERLSFQSYDVGKLLKPGENEIEIWLGDGWYRSQMLWKRSALYNTWGDAIAAIAELRAGPGEAAVLLKTDASWESGSLPILKSGIYFGEVYDARQMPGAATHGTEAVSFDHSTLVPHETTPVHEFEPIEVIEAWQDEQGRTIYDFGQNCAGYVELSVQGEPGAHVLIEHAEILNKGRVFDNTNYRSAEARLEYTLTGEGEERYKPHFTFFGFRYARAAITGKAEIRRIVLIPISSVNQPTASFSSANKLVNRLVLNTIWSQRSNFVDVPTDCPQRDERLGWTGDAQVFAPTACYLHDSHSFLRKWLRDLMADQRPDGAVPHFSPDPTRDHQDKVPGNAGSTGWGDAIHVVPWVLYTHYGDLDVLKETLPAAIRWNDFVWSISNGPIVRPPRAWGGRGFTFGDWLQPGGPGWPMHKAGMMTADDAAATIYLYISSVMTARIARLVGDEVNAQKLESRATEVKQAFAEEFMTPAGRLIYDDQTTHALAILWDLVPEQHRERVYARFRDTVERDQYRIGTGFIGTPALLPALVKIGAHDLAAKTLLQEDVPGWLYQVKTGATTIWERWDSIKADGSVFDPEMNSYNHYAYGAVCQWLFEAVAGFRPDPETPGFKSIIFEPVIIPELSPVAAHHDSATGRVAARWQLEGDQVTYEVEVPEGAAGALVLADHYQAVTVDGAAAENRGNTRIPLAPGMHTVRFRISGT